MDGFRVTRHVEPLCSLGEEETDQGHSECKCKAITKALNSSYFLVIYIWRINQAKITEARQSAARLSFGKQLAQCRYIWIELHTRQEMDNKSSQDYRRNPNKREQLQFVAKNFLLVSDVDSFSMFGYSIRVIRGRNLRAIAK